MTYKLHTAGMRRQPSISKGVLAKLICTRLTIQGIVHCSVVNERNHSPRWMFNLTVSIEVLVYQSRSGFESISKRGLKFLVGIVGINGPSLFIYSFKELKAR